MKITAPRVFMGVLLLFVVTILTFMLIIPSLGFFKVEFDRHGLNTAKIELIFDRLSFDTEKTVTLDGVTKTVAEHLDDLGYDEDAVWGSEQNPYIISQKYHVQNLSVLQNNGFFKERVKTDPTTGEPVLGDDGKPIPDQSFFLVCTPDGLPVAIDCDGMTIAPIGTHDRPFTGNIQGALFAGSTAYGSYGTSVSTIANVLVTASTSEPDIGFFGYISYHGTADTDDATGAPIVTGGYAANISNLLFADITIQSKDTVVSSLANWWSALTGHYNLKDEQQETHHVGIVAGHAEFATLTDISVFYSSDSVKTFELSGSTATNFYSITGLVGTLQHVNPTTTDGSLIGGAGNSVSDGDMLIEGGFGGGGAISGSLTGYMMAETLYNEHENVLKEQDADHSNGITGISEDGIYDVKAMLKHNTESDNPQYTSLFETVEMGERNTISILGDNWEYYDYYIFRDTVFTFAMSTSEHDAGDTTSDGSPVTDYIQKIWRLTDNPANDPTVTLAESSNAWQYVSDPNATSRVAYKLTRVTSASEITQGGYYVLTYHDKGADLNSIEDDSIYIFEVTSAGVTNGTCRQYDYEDFLQGSYTVNEETITIAAPVPATDGSGAINELTLPSENKIFFDYSFLYDKDSKGNRTISNPEPTQYGALGIHANRSSNASYFTQISAAVSTHETNVTERRRNGDQDEYSFHWTLTPNTNGLFAIYQNYVFEIEYNWLLSSDYFYTYGTAKLGFNNGFTFSISGPLNVENNKPSNFDPGLTSSDYCFTIYKISTNTLSNREISSLGSGNYELTPMNYLASGTTQTFDPSKYVLQADGSGYALTNIRSLNLNSGKGTYLDRINHIVKLYRATEHNFQLTISNSFLGGLFGTGLDTNNGGVVGAEIGTTGEYATIPTGMIAFHITEASTDEPSYINIIVAVNPGQTDTSRIGLWSMNDDNSWSSSFDINSPDQSFTLPISKVATNRNDSSYIYTITSRTIPVLNADNTQKYEDGKPVFTTDTKDYYSYFGGQTVLVYHSFAVTEAGTYLLGSGRGPMSVAYFSVSGAAGTGADGSSASPLGNVDFVYANGNSIITVDKKFTGLQNVEAEDHSYYYPSYYFVTMIPKPAGTTTVTKIQSETIYVRRYLLSGNNTSAGRIIRIYGYTNAKPKGMAGMYQDTLTPTPTS